MVAIPSRPGRHQVFVDHESKDIEAEDPFHEALGCGGFRIHLHPSVDVSVAMHVMRQYTRPKTDINTVVIVSGDQDFAELIRAGMDFSKTVHVVAHQECVSRRLVYRIPMDDDRRITLDSLLDELDQNADEPDHDLDIDMLQAEYLDQQRHDHAVEDAPNSKTLVDVGGSTMDVLTPMNVDDDMSDITQVWPRARPAPVTRLALRFHGNGKRNVYPDTLYSIEGEGEGEMGDVIRIKQEEQLVLGYAKINAPKGALATFKINPQGTAIRLDAPKGQSLHGFKAGPRTLPKDCTTCLVQPGMELIYGTGGRIVFTVIEA